MSEKQSPQEDTRVTRRERLVAEFLPLVGRSATDEWNGGDISPTKVVIEEVVEKVRRRL